MNQEVAEAGELGLQSCVVGFQAGVVGAEGGKFGILVLAVAGAGSIHALFDSALLHKFFFEIFQMVVEHGISHEAEGEGYVCHLLVVPFFEVGIVLLQPVMGFAESLHLVVAWMGGIPKRELPRDEVIEVVFAQFLLNGTRNVEQLDVHLGGGGAVLSTLNDVLLTRARCLHHLVDSAVAVRRQEALAEDEGHLVKSLRFLVVVGIAPRLLPLEDLELAA